MKCVGALTPLLLASCVTVAECGIITQIDVSDFDDAVVQTFESSPLYPWRDDPSILGAVDVKEITISHSGFFGGTFDSYDSNTTGKALFNRAGVPSARDVGVPLQLAHHEAWEILYLGSRTKFGFSFVDIAFLGGNATVEFFDGSSSVGSIGLPSTVSTEGLYFESDMAFNRIVIDPEAANGDMFGLDNFTVESSEVVPEPSGLALLGIGGLGLCGYRWRRRRKPCSGS